MNPQTHRVFPGGYFLTGKITRIGIDMQDDFTNDPAKMDTAVRLHVYRQVIDTCYLPTASETAAALDLTTKEAEESYQRLHDGHVLVLDSKTKNIWAAPPFSGVRTSFRVNVDDRSWWAS